MLLQRVVRIEEDIREIKSDIRDIRVDVADLKERMIRMEVSFERIYDRLANIPTTWTFVWVAIGTVLTALGVTAAAVPVIVSLIK